MVQCITTLSGRSAGTWLPNLLSRMDRAMHAEPHSSRSYYVAAWDQIKLAMLQDVQDVSAQAVCQVWSL